MYLQNDWQELLRTETEKEYFKDLIQTVKSAYQNEIIFPPERLVFNAFELCSFKATKVIILGQDPYHKINQACGLSFSVNNGVQLPPSLKNILKELQSDIPGFKIPINGNLEAWSKQGVLLLNSILTVKANSPGSHKDFAWQKFTDSVIKTISDQKQHLVFLLWGNFAKTKITLIDQQKHLVLTAAHPSPLARGAFSGNRHFSKTNDYLIKNNIDPIVWNLPESP
jgi:uracil-DNA glycosylase